MKVGRNDPCSCGSGKKYKKCCMREEKVSNIGDFEWVKLRHLEGDVIKNHLTPYVAKEVPKEWMEDALEYLLLYDISDEQVEALQDGFLIPWFLFNWLPEEETFEGERLKTIGETYLEVYGNKLSKNERAFLEAMKEAYYSFYSVVDVAPDQFLIIKDIMLGTEHKIKEKKGTQFLKRGDIIFNRILTLNNQSISIGMGPWIIPSHYHDNIIDFREAVRKGEGAMTPEVLRGETHFDLLEYFLRILEKLSSPTFPMIQNTDGEVLEFTKSYFKTDLSPEEVMDILLPMTLEEDNTHFLGEAERNKKGDIRRIEFPWLKQGNKKLKSLDTTILGHFTVEEKRVILETNSRERAERGKDLIEKYGKGKIQFQQMLLEDLENKLEDHKPSKQNKEIAFDDLPSEIQDQMREMSRQHWERWFDEPIPMLGDETPRVASKTKEGREKLEALLLHYENADKRMGGENLMKPDIPYLRKKLKLKQVEYVE